MKKSSINSGFTLIELAVVLVIVGIVISIVASVLPSLIKSSKIKKARAILEKVDYSLEGHLTGNGQFPYADSSTDGFGDSGVYFGNLPYRDLGLSSGDDAWGTRMKYGINENLVTSGTTTFCTELQDGCSPFSSTVLHINQSGTLTNMAYVIVSGGPKDMDNANGFFDGLNGIDNAEYDDPEKNFATNYDDLMIVKSCNEVSGIQGCGGGTGGGGGGGGGGTSAGENTYPSGCSNGVDDDGDGFTDCDDQDCFNVGSCGAGGSDVSITTTSIPSGVINSDYSVTFQATGGMTPYEWTLEDNGGFSDFFLHTYTGQLSGTLSQCPSTYSISVRITDSDPGNTDPSPSSFSIQVTTDLVVSRTSGSGTDITWSSPTQQETFKANGGHVGDITWSLDSGGATGFSVTSSGSDTCTISKSGATTAGSYTFTLTATDSTCTVNNTAQIILSVTVEAAASVAPYTVNLSAEWHMDECSWDGTTGEVEDSGDSGLDGTAKNGTDTIGSGSICSAGYFDGTNDYVDMGDILNNVFGTSSNSFSLAAWIRPASLGSTQTNHNTRNCFAAKASDPINDNFEIGVNPNGTIHVYIDSSGEDEYADFGVAGSVPVNIWSFVAVTYDNGSVAVTINENRYEDTSTWSGGGNLDNAAGSPFTIGSSQHIDNYFHGKIDEVMVFSTALSASEITELYTLTHTCSGSCYGDPIAIYYMDETSWTAGTADDVKDSSGNSYHGTPYGSISINSSDSHIGNAGHFQNGNSYVSITGLPVSTSSGDQTTVTFWMKWDGGNSEMPIGWTTYDLWFISDLFGFNTGGGDIYGINGASSKLEDDWHHIAAVFTNQGTSRNVLYIDGEEQSLSLLRGSQNNRNVNSTFRISGWTNSSGYRFDGLIDELRIYDRGLSSSEVALDKDLTH